MLFDKSEKLNVISHARSHSGIKICYENINRRTTDVLNAKGNILSIDPIKNKIIRNRAYEKINNYIENSLRSRSPYFAGQKNKEYISKNLTTSDFLFSVTNPEAKNNNYQELMHKVQVYKNKSDNNSEDNQPFNFFKPESAFISNKNDLSNRRGLNRSYIANNSINLLKDEDLQNRSAINADSNELCLNFKFNDKCKSHYDNIIKEKLKRNQFITENATLALMLINKPKEYLLPETKEHLVIKTTKLEDKKEPTSFDKHEKNKEIIFRKIKERVLNRKNLIENISSSLLIQQIREKEKLTNKFQHSENSFYKDNSKDHIRERYLKKYHQENLNKLRQNTFYEKIRAINSKHFEFNDEISHLNLDNNYKNIKKVKEILHQSKNINKEIENSKKCINMGIKKFIIEIPENRRLKSREKEKKVWY